MLDLQPMPDNLVISVTTQDALLQLAEEASELSQAALKYVRVLKGSNPTPVSELAARDHLIEEIADVMVCVRLIMAQSAAGIQLDEITSSRIKLVEEGKISRWDSRIKEAQK